MDIWYGAAAAVRLAEGVPLREALDTGDPAAWIALDAGVRTISWDTERVVWLPAWEKTEGGRAVKDALLSGGPLGEGQLALALCHREGRVREASLWRAVDFPGLLPLLVVRCSDWAAPVREVARRRLTETLDAEAAVRVMGLVLRIGRRDRGTSSALWPPRCCGPRFRRRSPRCTPTRIEGYAGTRTGSPSTRGSSPRRVGPGRRP